MASSVPPHAQVQRVAMTLDIKPELVDEYIAAHAAPRQQVVDALRSVGLRNLSLWVSRERLFYYAEFAPVGGETFDEAMARYAKMPGVKEWEEVRALPTFRMLRCNFSAHHAVQFSRDSLLTTCSLLPCALTGHRTCSHRVTLSWLCGHRICTSIKRVSREQRALPRRRKTFGGKCANPFTIRRELYYSPVGE
jgi:L-rhamnose mutarotase